MRRSQFFFRLLHLAQEDNPKELHQFILKNKEYDPIPWTNVYHEKSGDTVLHVAARNGAMGVLKTPLMLACTKNNLNVIRALVEGGANLLLRNKDGWNSFHIACREGNSDIINYLVEQTSLQLDTVSKNGRTPLHTAALHGHLKIVDIILNREHNLLDRQDSCGSTPLMDASRGGYIDIVDILIKHGANISYQDALGRNALHLAAQAGSIKACEHLVQVYGMNVNSTSPLGQTALHFAAKEGQSEVIYKLVQLGANIRALDNKGRRAEDIATGVRHKKCVQLLQDLDQ
ncbi:ankyrin repeat domain-containing protein 16-like isoform X2 [Limulus polyphemus]|uniref:Alpha-latrotoxin n=1 Tax=Limulus polyphemus TaxID=6850 RepID=A0ABM1S3N2_LIMPO|nr:ankyrin repeat domain-containing protein 16-like isoform X2 [Limulus polyphemus]